MLENRRYVRFDISVKYLLHTEPSVNVVGDSVKGVFFITVSLTYLSHGHLRQAARKSPLQLCLTCIST